MQLEGAHYSFVVPGGQPAIALIYLSHCQSGSDALVPFSVYGPNKAMAQGLLKGLGIEVEGYEPLIGEGIAALIRPNTTLICVESPGSVTMEIQDVPAICAAAHLQGVPVALDNTYAAGVLFHAFAHGVDIRMQALTKYLGGHSDHLLGTVSVNSEAACTRVGAIFKQLGLAVSLDGCSPALRGMQTMGVRLAHLETATLEIGPLAGRSARDRHSAASGIAVMPGPCVLAARLYRIGQRVFDCSQRSFQCPPGRSLLRTGCSFIRSG